MANGCRNQILTKGKNKSSLFVGPGTSCPCGKVVKPGPDIMDYADRNLQKLKTSLIGRCPFWITSRGKFYN
jgi:hypothetical protein